MRAAGNVSVEAIMVAMAPRMNDCQHAPLCHRKDASNILLVRGLTSNILLVSSCLCSNILLVRGLTSNILLVRGLTSNILLVRGLTSNWPYLSR